jgi:hypothetical protein
MQDCVKQFATKLVILTSLKVRNNLVSMQRRSYIWSYYKF